MKNNSDHKQLLNLLLKVNDDLPIGILLMDNQGDIIFANKRLSTIFSTKTDRFVQQNAQSLFPAISGYISQALEDQVHYFDLELTEFRELLWMDLIPLSLQPHSHFLYALIRTYPVGLKSHGQVGLENKISQEMAMILDSAFDGFWICDADGRVCWINKSSAQLNNIDTSAVVGKKMEDLVTQGIIDRSVTLEVYKKKQPVTFVQSMPNERKILVTGSPVLGDDGDLELVVVNERDITELGVLRQELEKSKKLIEGYQIELNQLNSVNRLFTPSSFQSKVMHQVLSTISKASATEVSILLQGEFGVGKSELANLIHLNSSRKEHPFVQFNCNSLSKEMIEKELFGTQKSTASDESRASIGLLEIMDCGTLYLENISVLPANIQTKLMQFIERKFSPSTLSPSNTITDVRFIVSSNEPLQEKVDNGHFRKDLYFCFNSVTLDIPPLCERVDDIPPLVKFYLSKFNKSNSTQKTIDRRVLDVLKQYAFPENLRELHSLVEQIATLSTSNKIEVGDLPSNILPNSNWLSPAETGIDLTLPQAVEKMEKRMITDAFKLYSNQIQAASFLGINQSTLSRKIKKYKLTFPVF